VLVYSHDRCLTRKVHAPLLDGSERALEILCCLPE
jgi:hypothetical protein